MRVGSCCNCSSCLQLILKLLKIKLCKLHIYIYACLFLEIFVKKDVLPLLLILKFEEEQHVLLLCPLPFSASIIFEVLSNVLE